MHKITIATIVTLSLAVASCNNASEEKKQPETKMDTGVVITTPEKADTTKKINIAEADLADKKDPVCGMPAFKYLQDTAHYDNKIYGFCSKDCKDEFLKDPKQYVKNEAPAKAGK